jgi:hypothetical protein
MFITLPILQYSKPKQLDLLNALSKPETRPTLTRDASHFTESSRKAEIGDG